ncbi:hypothetical protein LOTGIDRAFT_238800 [Lottia gigantea]|uniref:ATP-dependent RNA helicase n=1 Tax=Lottia gigantea TaxID=225164 RepID=V4B0G8_LOTGI|nr:hypothetical protein LOTGIDRAFT_238800 [Lottia gigantea]ESO99581.1 hypothetical protein LOTGIDRAFT_238800 [Lottia gigantea]
MPVVSDISSKQVKEGPHLVGNFTVLGEFKLEPEKKVKQYLPEWLAKPGIIKTDLEKTPVEDLDMLHPCLVEKLKENNISHFFPVQTSILPLILKDCGGQVGFSRTGSPLRDVCVSAPTGSGKTLAYVLPILHILLPRNVCRIRALVVLPVRDLALQVFKVFENYCQGTQLKVKLLGGQQAFEEEQQTLVVEKMAGYLSLVDIIVATPGRLVDHINKTPGFDLSRLRFLVIDEADRMMDNIKQNWLQVVEKHVFKVHNPDDPVKRLDRTRTPEGTQASCDGKKLAFQKLLFSATLSQDPEILQQLKLFQPQLFTTLVSSKHTQNKETKDVSSKKKEKHVKDKQSDLEEGEFVGKYSTPSTLKQLHVECKAMDKPLIVLHCLHNLQYRQILCFTNSVESTHRLYLLIKLYGDVEVREFSSALTVAAREKILQEFAQGKVDMVICSDAMARGIDIDNVQYVILYDRPLHIQNYIHRVGRTARAGKTGTAITILEKREVCTYKAMLRESGKDKFKKLKIKPNKLFSLKPRYNDSLRKLPMILKEEKRGKRTY